MEAFETRNGHSGYLADGRRVQVPEWFEGSVYRVREFEAPVLSLAVDPSRLVACRERLLHRLRCVYPPGMLGPVEGDGSWLSDDPTGARIITLFVEAGAPIWGRLHRRG